MPLQQTTFENIVAKREIAQNEQFLLLPQCYQLCLVIIPIFIEMFYCFAKMFSKSSAAESLYVGRLKKGLSGSGLDSMYFTGVVYRNLFENSRLHQYKALQPFLVNQHF